jgi:hypothetical protein
MKGPSQEINLEFKGRILRQMDKQLLKKILIINLSKQCLRLCLWVKRCSEANQSISNSLKKYLKSKLKLSSKLMNKKPQDKSLLERLIPPNNKAQNLSSVERTHLMGIRMIPLQDRYLANLIPELYRV